MPMTPGEKYVKCFDGHALRIFSSSHFMDFNLIIQSDSKVGLSWVTNNSQRPWEYWQIFNEMDALSHMIGNITFIHVPREGNSLAKLGVDRSSTFSASW
ncbi:Uncharacterized protein TCM_025446 [Theobroma cacao]|uniref:RNase H type-1 domain-containing protein n=1 Tax=Theobroma cacao TaxID=3641 RepID=A0A061EZG3_THECC|nr:Uncharacterized protein TCM_025446 [Theobroma cacao]